MKKQKQKQIKAIVLHETSLSPRQTDVISAQTPQIFIKEKPGRGGKKMSYVETGYVVYVLNKAFSPFGWDFEIVEQGQTERKNGNNTEGEVWVKGRLTIKDHKSGFSVSKTQYGQHDIHKNVPIGDAFKSASSDALKKCASLFGIAQDVYWQIAEQEEHKESKKVQKPMTATEGIEMMKKIINTTNSRDILFAMLEKLKESKMYNIKQKEELEKMISGKVDELDTK